MATITGLKLSELSTLLLGTTGTLTYVSTANQSFKMSMGALYNTINKFYISGNYQPKIEDWRFVHKTGDELITGDKYFVNSIYTPLIYSLSDPVGTTTALTVDINNKLLFTNEGLVNSLDWNTGYLKDLTSIISVDWNNRILSGNWSADNLQISGHNVITGNSSTTYLSGFTDSFLVHRYGTESITGAKTFDGTVAFNSITTYIGPALFNNVLNANGGITTDIMTGNSIWNTTFSNTRSLSADFSNRQLIADNSPSSNNQVTLDWQNRVLSGLEWTASGLNVTNSLSGSYIRAPLISGDTQRMKVDFNHCTLNHKNASLGVVNLIDTGLYFIGHTSGTQGFHILGAEIRTDPSDTITPFAFNIVDNLRNVVISTVTGRQASNSRTDRWLFSNGFDNHISRLSLFGYYEYAEGFVG